MSRPATLALALAAGAALGAATRAGRRRLDLRGRVALVTGGSRGLGLALARELGARGARVAICARDETTLARARKDLARRGTEALAVPCDVGDPDATRALVERVLQQWGRLDVLVANAGIIQVGPLATMTLDDFREAMRVNFWGAVHPALAAIPVMRRQGGGRIVTISSIGGKIAVPHLAPYDASKFAVAGFSEALGAELAGDSILVTTVYPGLMRTGSPRHATFKGRHRAEFAWFSIGDSLPGVSTSVERAARRIVDACERGEPHVVFTVPARAAALVRGLFPGTVLRLLAAAAALLPAADGAGGRAVPGRESESAWSPSALTALGDRAGRQHNQAG